MINKTKLLIVHHRHEFYRDYLEKHSDLFEIDSFDFREPIPFSSHDAEILFCWKIQEGLLDKLPQLKWVAATSAGVEHILGALPQDSGVVVTRAKGTMGQFMGEYVIQHMLNHIRNMRTVYEQQHERLWRHVKSDLLSRYTLGILGYGSIGTEIARLAKSFGMTVLAARRSSDNMSDEQKQSCDELFFGDDWHDMMPRSDFLVITLPLTRLTRGMIGAEKLAAMKRSAVLINIARGSIVQEKALLDALKKDVIAGAVLDVFDEEPLPPNHPFWRMPNVTITPHCSGPSEEGPICDELLENYRLWKEGKPLNLQVDFTKGY